MAFPKLWEYHTIDLIEFLFAAATMNNAGLLAQETHKSKEKKKAGIHFAVL